MGVQLRLDSARFAPQRNGYAAELIAGVDKRSETCKLFGGSQRIAAAAAGIPAGVGCAVPGVGRCGRCKKRKSGKQHGRCTYSKQESFQFQALFLLSGSV